MRHTVDWEKKIMFGLESSFFYNTGIVPKMSKSKRGENFWTSAPCRKLFQQMVEMNMKHSAMSGRTKTWSVVKCGTD